MSLFTVTDDKAESLFSLIDHNGVKHYATATSNLIDGTKQLDVDDFTLVKVTNNKVEIFEPHPSPCEMIAKSPEDADAIFANEILNIFNMNVSDMTCDNCNKVRPIFYDGDTDETRCTDCMGK